MKDLLDEVSHAGEGVAILGEAETRLEFGVLQLVLSRRDTNRGLAEVEAQPV